MASEAELERLYQEFVNRGGGAFTFSNVNTTPAQYYSTVSSSTLTPTQQAFLQSQQEQFNRQAALSTIASEIAGNNFSNPYIGRADNSIGLIGTFSNTLATITGIGSIDVALNNFSATDKALIFAGVLSATGVDLDKILKIGTIAGLGLAMFNSLKNHTAGQMTNLPQTLSDASSLAGMNAQFGEQRESCSFFNEILGILSGAFDGTMDFIDGVFEKLNGFLQQTGVTGALDSIANAISQAGGIVGDVINAITNAIGSLTSAVGDILGQMGSLIGKAINAIADVTNQIANEASKLLNLATELASKALALAMAAAALDPCQMAVILNTGSQDMKGAVNKLNTPLGQEPDIPTQVDSRADADTVIKTMDQAKQEASQSSGVPQSPFTNTGKTHQPLDAYLHNLFTEITGIFGDTFETLKNAVGGNTITPLPNTGSTASSSTAPKTKTSTTISSDAWKLWQSTYSNQLLGLKRDVKSLKIEISDAISNKTFSTEELKNQAIILADMLATDETLLSQELKRANSQLVYQSEGNKFRIQTREDEKMAFYNSTTSPSTQRLINRVSRELASARVQWNSIDQNVR
jgi:hypothetical protein|tara:strand:+ start:220 stop:1953 length:1734 start_codon:yes stop_codon:yes gene_type:complete